MTSARVGRCFHWLQRAPSEGSAPEQVEATISAGRGFAAPMFAGPVAAAGPGPAAPAPFAEEYEDSVDYNNYYSEYDYRESSSEDDEDYERPRFFHRYYQGTYYPLLYCCV